MEASTQPQVDIDLIEVSGANPRKDIKGESFKELKDSIREHGIIEPLVVRPKGEKFELVAGERRLTAAKELKLEKVPVSIRELDDHTARVLMLLENLQREDLEPLEEAAAIEELLKDTGDGGMTQQELAKKLGKSQPWVANRIRLLKAPAELRKHLEKGEISPQHIVALLPYVERKELRGEILLGLKNALEDIEFNGPVTVESVKDMAEQILDEQGQDLGLNDYIYQGLAKFFDYSVCDTCEKTLTVGDGPKKSRKVCLVKECFAEHIETARKKLQETQKDKVAKSEVVNTEKMSYRDYVSFDSYNKPTFDTSDCKNCPNHKLQKSRYARFGKDKDELEEICLKPSCYRGKNAQVSRVKNKAVREELSFVDKSLEKYLTARAPGFTLTELKYICERIADIAPHSYGRGDDLRSAKGTIKKGTAADLEAAVLRTLAREQLGPIRFNLSMQDLRDVEKELPFKVTKEKTPEVPKAKKVQEKRKKKEEKPCR